MVKRSLTDSVKKHEKPSLSPIHCKGCTITFTPADHRHHFHSAACRERFYMRTYFSKATATKICPNCEEAFTTTKPGRQTYCTPGCRQDAQLKKREAVIAELLREEDMKRKEEGA